MKKSSKGSLLEFGFIVFGMMIFAGMALLSDYTVMAGSKTGIADGLKSVTKESVDKAIMNEYQGWELKVVVSSEIVEEGKIKIACIDKNGEKNIYLVIRVIGNDENYFSDFWAPKDGIYKICLVRPIPSYRRNMEPKMAFFDYFLWVGDLDTNKTPAKFSERKYK